MPSQTPSELPLNIDEYLARFPDHEESVRSAFLEALQHAPVPVFGDTAGESIGSVVGQYTLRELIGEGGMGLVYVADQSVPVRREVALKIIKPGMDSKEVIARFEAERQALAKMNHPNIANIMDVGKTSAGRPYFAMELIRGKPITEYCNIHKLSVQERLHLFVTVCHAVQHAHRKGIIHRDIKPSNILVERHDGRSVPEVIDFDVAKATGELTNQAINTRVSQLIGTPMYMSPEQAALSRLDVDTRTDIYSLGVVLYELLTGTTPITKERLSEVGYDEIRRVIRDDEPPRSSARLSALAARDRAAFAEIRAAGPFRLTQTFRGELDWIVLKAMEKDQSRRYKSANDLATDIQRYLTDDTVLACPPSTVYRVTRFARRNKIVLSVISLSIVGLLACVTGLAVSNDLIGRERHATDQTGLHFGCLHRPLTVRTI